MVSPVVSYRGFAAAVMPDARSISKSHHAAIVTVVIIHVNACHAAAVNYRSGSVAGSVVLVQRYPDAHARVRKFPAANVVAIFHYLRALNANVAR